jgi:uncharacterized protein DUF1629
MSEAVSGVQTNYVIFHGPMRSEFCVLGFLKGFPDGWKLKKGHSVAKEWPSDASFHMDPDFPRRIKLSDNLVNSDDFIVASPRLQEFLKQEKVPNLELLPVKVFNHKKKVATSEYSVVNQITTQDCVDSKASVVVWNKINPDDISRVEKLVLDDRKVDPAATLFRVKHLPAKILVRRDLAKKLLDRGFTGIEFKEVADLKGA